MAIGPHLPALRRYARAATGSAVLGDAALAAGLPALMAEAEATGIPHRRDLLAALIAGLNGSNLVVLGRSGTLPDIIAGLPWLPRHALLLTTLEGLTEAEAAGTLGVTPAALSDALAAARAALDHCRPARVLIIGDAPNALARVVAGLGHAVSGAVANEDAAWQAARRSLPDLVLVEVAGDGDGLQAASRIAANDLAPVVVVGDATLAAHGFPLVRQPWGEAALRQAIGLALRGHHGRTG